MVVEATYNLHLNKYFEILNLKSGGRSLVTRRFGPYSNSQGVRMVILIDFRPLKHGVVTSATDY